MKIKNKLFIVALIVFICGSLLCEAQNPFVGPIKLKGQYKNFQFTGRDFKINLDGNIYKISARGNGNRAFMVEFSGRNFRDIVFSQKGAAISILLGDPTSTKERMVLITVDSAGKKRTYKYPARKMTKRLGWIVELGAVSNDGRVLLAKCARILPPDSEGISYVRHVWSVLKINNGSIHEASSENAIEEWAGYRDNSQ